MILHACLPSIVVDNIFSIFPVFLLSTPQAVEDKQWELDQNYFTSLARWTAFFRKSKSVQSPLIFKIYKLTIIICSFIFFYIFNSTSLGQSVVFHLTVDGNINPYVDWMQVYSSCVVTNALFALKTWWLFCYCDFLSLWTLLEHIQITGLYWKVDNTACIRCLSCCTKYLASRLRRCCNIIVLNFHHIAISPFCNLDGLP